MADQSGGSPAPQLLPSRVVDHPILGPAAPSRWITIHLDDRSIPAREGESLAAAILASGRKTFRYTFNVQKLFKIMERFPSFSETAWKLEPLLPLLPRLRAIVPRRFGLFEPRGYYCGVGRCTECLMIVNGVPNTRTCLTPVVDGMQVRTPIGLGDWRPADGLEPEAKVR